jgi:hypothetical protein
MVVLTCTIIQSLSIGRAEIWAQAGCLTQVNVPDGALRKLSVPVQEHTDAQR